MAFEVGQPPADMVPKIEAATQEALELDEGLGEAHMSQASIFNYSCNFRGAEKEYRRAIELVPGNVPVRRALAQVLRNQGRFDEAIAEMRRAQELDPLSASGPCPTGAVDAEK